MLNIARLFFLSFCLRAHHIPGVSWVTGQNIQSLCPNRWATGQNVYVVKAIYVRTTGPFMCMVSQVRVSLLVQT